MFVSDHPQRRGEEEEAASGHDVRAELFETPGDVYGFFRADRGRGSPISCERCRGHQSFTAHPKPEAGETSRWDAGRGVGRSNRVVNRLS